jgi:hypothetical protein
LSYFDSAVWGAIPLVIPLWISYLFWKAFYIYAAP